MIIQISILIFMIKNFVINYKSQKYYFNFNKIDINNSHLYQVNYNQRKI